MWIMRRVLCEAHIRIVYIFSNDERTGLDRIVEAKRQNEREFLATKFQRYFFDIKKWSNAYLMPTNQQLDCDLWTEWFLELQRERKKFWKFGYVLITKSVAHATYPSILVCRITSMFCPLISSQNQNLWFSYVHHGRSANSLVSNHDTQSSTNVNTQVLTQSRWRRSLLKRKKINWPIKIWILYGNNEMNENKIGAIRGTPLMRVRSFIYVTRRTESDKINERKLHLIRDKSKVCGSGIDGARMDRFGFRTGLSMWRSKFLAEQYVCGESSLYSLRKNYYVFHFCLHCSHHLN